MISIKQILEIPQFSGITILNHQGDLTRPVESADISETPDIVGYLAPNTLLITTGMAFKDNQQDLCRLIEELSQLPAAGLGIKLGRYIEKLDSCVIETANRLHFPLLKVPMSTTLGMVCHQLLSYIWDLQREKLHYALSIQKEFSKMLIEDSSLSSLICHLGKVLKQNVFLINPFMDIVATSLPLNKTNAIILKALDAIHENILYQQAKIEENTFELCISNTKTICVSVFPVKVTTFNPYLLVILKSDKIPYPYSQLVIEQASTILAFTLFKNKKLEELSWKLREEFFDKLIKNKDASNVSNLIEYGHKYGLIESSSYRIIMVGIDNYISYNDLHQTDIYTITYEWLEREISTKFENASLFPLSNKEKLVILLQSSEQNLEQILMEISNSLNKYFSISLSFAIGNEVSQLFSTYFSFIEAEETYHRCRKEGKTSFIKFYLSKGILEVLQFIPKEHISHFCIYTLKTLAYPTNDIQIELRKTLQTYLDCQGKITETANSLYVHRNTVKYRIAKLNELFDQSIDNPDYSLQLRVALLLSQ
ncbi:PucR family transcriptional regulator [Inediibacterium massiliense]|uniref:PucR family transcriptional regulator n=1 Tax=Inediibacterium massiliense TaxID=1658111 RepID=UPI0006B61539|nr:PucR family transcriptional regulator [Inediibacterium massiliense]